MADLSSAELAAHSSADTRWERQRSALEQLMFLAAECSQIDRRLEEEHAKATRRADNEFAGADAMLDARLRGAKEKADQTAREQAEAIEADHQNRRAELDETAAHKRSQIDDKYGRLGKSIQKKLRDALWLADTVLESERHRIHEQHELAEKQVREHHDALDALHEEANQYAERIGHPLPDATGTVSDEPRDVENRPARLEANRDDVQARVSALKGMPLPKLLVGATPWVLLVVLILLVGIGAHAATADAANAQALLSTTPDWPIVGGAAAAAAVLLVGLGVVLKRRASAQASTATAELAQAFANARATADAELAASSKLADEQLAAAKANHERETGSAHEEFDPQLDKVKKEHAVFVRKLEEQVQQRRRVFEQERDAKLAEVEAERVKQIAEAEREHAAAAEPARQRHDAKVAESQKAYDEGRAALERRWDEALRITRQIAHESDRPEFAAIGDWRAWRPPQTFAPTVRFGELQVDLRRFADQPGGNGELRLPIPEPYELPALLAFPDHANLLIKHSPDGRDAAVATLRLAMTRLLTSLPAGRVQFTLIDPVGLGRSFAGFMHLADYDDALVGGRVWTESEAIEKRLADLTEHMETVIQKYLRNEFETIDAYNAQAGELAEPYRFLVIADLPAGFSEAALRRLASIAESGPRCGVHVLAAFDVRQSVPGASTLLDDLERNSTTLVHEGEKFRWDDTVFGKFPLALDTPPDESALTDVLHVVGRAARDAKRVEVPFSTITPSDEEMWSRDSATDLQVPVGRTGATRLQSFRLGKGVAQHALVAGKTGSGKSTLLNGLIVNLSMWYAPDQLSLYLIDFKRGVEFKAYATHNLPHAKAIAVESDREFGLSVLQKLDAELGRRGDLFRDAGVQDVAGYRRARPGEAMPRILLVVDEFQELFSEDDKLSQDAALLIDRLVRQGRAFGIHVILGSQTIGGTAGLGRATLGQMAVRVALQCTEADSQLILGDNNSAARLLSRPGEAIYNDAGGAIEANSPFQVAWLSDEERDGFLSRVREKAIASGIDGERAVVFEGNAPARLEENTELKVALAGNSPRKLAGYLGEPVAIKEPTHIRLRHQSGSNLLIVGQQEETATALLASCMIGLVATAGDALVPEFRMLDATPADAPHAGVLRRVVDALPAAADFVDHRAVPDAMADLADELRGRLDGSRPDRQPVVLIINGLQRYRDLKRSEDDFGLSSSSGGGFGAILGESDDDAPKASPPVRPDQVLADVLRDGPGVGMHVIATIDTLASIERRLSRDSLREFETRVLFQMSANDSSVLIDSPAANTLGFYRALVSSEEQGTIEKFRPYALPGGKFLDDLRDRLSAGATA